MNESELIFCRLQLDGMYHQRGLARKEYERALRVAEEARLDLQDMDDEIDSHEFLIEYLEDMLKEDEGIE